MTPTARMKSLMISWDFFAALVSTLLAGIYLFSVSLPFDMAKDIFSVSVSVLSIVFSIFFAALAVLITAGDDKFVRFLQENGLYMEIIWYFKFTLFLLFTALAASIVLFVTSLPYASTAPSTPYPTWIMLLFSFLAPYALFAAVNSSRQAIKYAEYRAAFLKIIGDDDNC